MKIVVCERDSKNVATKSITHSFGIGTLRTLEMARRVSENIDRRWLVIRNPHRENRPRHSYVRKVLTAEERKEMYREAVKGLKESSHLRTILEGGNAKGEES